MGGKRVIYFQNPEVHSKGVKGKSCTEGFWMVSCEDSGKCKVQSLDV